jgi:hypothetical protein
MWNYHTIAEAVHETNRFIASHGRGCVTGGNNCGITVGDIATKLKTLAVGIPDSTINMTLTSASGTTVVCNPLSASESDTTPWPPTANLDNSAGNYSTLTASVTVQSAIVALWYGTSGQRISSITLPSTSKVRIVF